MSYYVQGNLALKQEVENNPTQSTAKRKRKTKPTIPLGEKMLYLASILACVVVAGAVLWQYAQIYSINTRIQQVEKEIRLLEKENNALQLEGQRLQEPKRLLEYGKELGFVPTSEEAVIPVSPHRHVVMSTEKKVAYLD